MSRYVIGRRLGMGGFGVVYAAHDEALDRAVAIKVPWPGLRTADRIAQLQREAQTMARLRHPNIVTVFDVDLADEHPYIVMELIDGGSMRGWLARERPSTSAITAAFIDAARGLAAAHRVGLVHRDVKLSNLLVARDGRVLVSDFGLVDASAADPTAGAPRPRGWAGTEVYMAPERLRGEGADPRSDQYALCVALYVALYGHPPFEGATPRERMEAKLAGLAGAALRRDIPRHVREVIVRGLSARASDRFASLDVLIDALDRRSRRRPAVLMGALGSIAGTLVLAAGELSAGHHECREASTLSLWPTDRAAAVDLALRTTAAPFATASSEQIDHQLSTYADRWSRDYEAACSARSGTLRERLELDTTLRCLHRMRLRVEALTGALAEAERPMVEHAALAVEMLPLAGHCWSSVEPSWASGPQADAIEEQLAQAEVLRELGNYALAEELAELAHRQAEASGATGAAARARLQQGLARLQLADFDHALADLEAAYFAARAEHDESTALRAATELLQAAVTHVPDSQAAERWERASETLGEPSALDDDARARLLHAKAERAARAGHQHERVRLHREALALRRGQGEVRALALASSLEGLGRAHMDQQNVDEARSTFRQVLELRTHRLGPDHPSVAIAHNNYGIALAHAGQQDDGLAELETGLRLLETSLGSTHPRVARVLSNLGSFTLHQGLMGPSLRYFERAVAILAATQGSSHPETLQTRASLAEALRRTGAHERAVDEARRALAEAESGLMPPAERAFLHSVLGMALVSIDQPEQALAVFEGGGALVEPDDSLGPWLDFQVKIIAVSRALGRTDEAHRIARNAWSRLEPGTPRGALALAISRLEAQRSNHRDALSMARIARDEIVPGSDPEHARRDEIDGWIDEIEAMHAAATVDRP